MDRGWIRTIMAIGALFLALVLASCRPEVRDNQPETGTMPLLAPTDADETLETE